MGYTRDTQGIVRLGKNILFGNAFSLRALMFIVAGCCKCRQMNRNVNEGSLTLCIFLPQPEDPKVPSFKILLQVRFNLLLRLLPLPSNVLPSHVGKRKYGGQTSKRNHYSAATSSILSIFDGPKISNRLSSECQSCARFQFISESVDVGFGFLEPSGCARRRASFSSGSKGPDRIQ